MKMFVAVLFSLLTSHSHAQDLIKGLEEYQKEIKPAPSTSADGKEVKVDPVEKTKTSGQCLDSIQSSLPLKFVSALMLEKDPKLTLKHDSINGKLSISSPEMIANCNGMIEWTPDAKVVDGRKIYTIEAKIRQGDNCETVDKKTVCSYPMMKVVDGKFKEAEQTKVEPSMAGFEQCLLNSGALSKEGKVVAGAIYPAEVSEKFSGFKESGEVQFLSVGNSSKMTKAKYDKFLEVDGCKHYEMINPQTVFLKSLEDEERAKILAEKEEIMKCGDYQRIADFRERHKEFSDEVDPIIEALMMGMIQKSTKAVAEGKYSEEDLKVILSFEKLVVNPQIEKAKALYEQSMELEGSALAAKLEELKKVQAQLNVLNSPPYISANIVQRMEADGRFDEALKINGMKAGLASYARLGAKENGIVITADVAAAKVSTLMAAYEKEIGVKKERYDIATGQTPAGQAQAYYQLVRDLRTNIQVRSQNYMAEIQSEYQRMQPGGHCYKPFRNVQRCLMDSQERIQELQQSLAYFNKVDNDRAIEYEAKARDYAELEKQGRAYVARQTGEQIPEPQLNTNTTPAPRNNSYDYNMGGYNPTGYGTPNQQMNPQMQYSGQQQSQYNPYGQSMFGMQQNPYQAYQQPGWNQMGGQYYAQFGFGGQGQFGGQQQYNPYGMQQNPYGYQQYGQQQGGFWNNPMQAYGSYGNNMGGYNPSGYGAFR